MKKETRGAPKKLLSEKVVGIQVYVRKKNHVKAKAAIKELAAQFK
jgi:hypothetical protein